MSKASGSRDENLRQAGQPRGHLVGVERVIQLGLVLVEGPDPAAVLRRRLPPPAGAARVGDPRLGTVVAACFGKRGSGWMATRLPPTNVCWPSRSSICCIRTSPACASACHSIRASSSVDITGFFGMPAIVPGIAQTVRLIQHLDFGAGMDIDWAWPLLTRCSLRRLPPPAPRPAARHPLRNSQSPAPSSGASPPAVAGKGPNAGWPQPPCERMTGHGAVRR